jgi:hypothetical protein
MEVLGHEFIPDQWRLFIDSSKVSLKVVLLHNGNKLHGDGHGYLFQVGGGNVKLERTVK